MELFKSKRVKFNDCQENKAVGYESSDPDFKVRMDGSIYAVREMPRLSEAVQFTVTARRTTDPQTWETTVRLSMEGQDVTLPDEHKSTSTEDETSPTESDLEIENTLLPWKQQPRSSGLKRQKRDWVIPPVNVPENSRGPFPQMLVRPNLCMGFPPNTLDLTYLRQALLNVGPSHVSLEAMGGGSPC
ncbi:CADH4 protein, partial [Polypterus senegalus]|nr:CADH4 protein [Polypterus senegalus]